MLLYLAGARQCFHVGSFDDRKQKTLVWTFFPRTFFFPVQTLLPRGLFMQFCNQRKKKTFPNKPLTSEHRAMIAALLYKPSCKKKIWQISISSLSQFVARHCVWWDWWEKRRCEVECREWHLARAGCRSSSWNVRDRVSRLFRLRREVKPHGVQLNSIEKWIKRRALECFMSR